MNDATLADQVRTLQRVLQGGGWVIANAVGELRTEDGVLWFTATYVHGEYTAEASYRPKGYGTAQGATRIRITPELARAYPFLGRTLAQELLDKALEVSNLPVDKTIEDIAWPPPLWAELAR